MANDIYCTLEIECFTEEKANEIAALAENEGGEEEFDFNKFIPLGENEYPVDKWGTKWFKDTSCELVDDTVLFCTVTTAWNAPYKFVEEFCKKYKVHIGMHYYDTDNIGANCGVYEVDEDGDVDEDEYYAEQSSESLKFIAKAFGEEELDFLGFKKDDNGEWHYVEDDEHKWLHEDKEE